MTGKTRGTATQAARRTGTVVILRPTTTSHPAILGKGRRSNIQVKNTPLVPYQLESLL